MALVTDWFIKNMIRDTATGGVNAVYWECSVGDDVHTDCISVDGGKAKFNPDPDDDSFVDFDDLTEATVLGWVWESLADIEEPADDAKARVEQARQDNVTNQISRKSGQSTGVPW